MEKELKTGALYIRVSTDKQEELSPDAQKRLLLDYAKNNKILISQQHIYIENGISGRKAEKRPEFMSMISAAKSKEHPFDVILVWKYSRFARNQEESIVYKSLLRKQCNVDVISISEPLIDGPFGSLIERIIEWMDEYYSIRLSGEVRRGMTEKALRGGYQSKPPLGYKMENKIPIIVEQEAEIVKKIFNDYLDGHDETSIARTLNDCGYKTSRGKAFDNRGIQYILENPFYIGKVRWNYAEKHGARKANTEDDVIIADGSHEAIITFEEFKKAQERRQKEYKPPRRRSTSTTKHWVTGVLKCGYCGASLVYASPKPRKNGGSSPFFQCHAYSSGKHSGSCAITETKVIDAILSSLQAFIESTSPTFSIIGRSDNSSTLKLKNLENELKKLETRAQRAKIAYLDGIDTKEEYLENKTMIAKMKEEIEEKIKELSMPQMDLKQAEQIMKKRVEEVYRILSSDADNEKKGNSLRNVISIITFHRDTGSFEFAYFLSL
ncbi:MAG: recombinase family protein [Clostridiales bacterium]|nr:recombinase family protein [Clostridiales bacterium]